MALEENFKYFMVVSKGYKKQFVNQTTARRKFTEIEKKAIKDEEAVSVMLSGKDNIEDDWVVMDEVKIGESYYDK